MTAEIRIGCSGWNYRHWRALVYPEKVAVRDWLVYYATLFDTVELNTTLYRLPSREAVARWVATTPAEFVFATKASRYLTHIRRLRDLDDGIARFYERIEPLVESPKLGPILWQLPERFHRDDDRLASALEALPRGRHAFEFRHPSWFVPEVFGVLRAHGAALVIGDHPTRPFQTEEPTAAWTYVRFHYGHRGRDGNYSAGELGAWAQKLATWRARGDVFAYFNNDWRGYAVANGIALKAALGLRDTPGAAQRA